MPVQHFRDPLRPHPERDLRGAQVKIRKAGGDGNDLTVTRHRDGTVSVKGRGHDGRNRTRRAATLAEAAVDLVDVVHADAAKAERDREQEGGRPRR